MNNGLFGFFIGANVTINVQEFDTDGVWIKPPNAQLCFIEATGGGQAGGGSAGTAGNRLGGCAGVAYQIVLNASELQQNEAVDIGAGGIGANQATGPDGSDTIFAGLYWAGGTGGSGSTSIRHPYHGTSAGVGWGAGGQSGATNVDGCHGGWGAGGGGRGGTSGTGTGGKPRSFQWGTGTNSGAPLRGGGAPANTAANPANDVDGFGEGAAGGQGTAAGKNGRRGSGGGAVGATATNTPGGNGGDGFLRVITYCWE